MRICGRKEVGEVRGRGQVPSGSRTGASVASRHVRRGHSLELYAVQQPEQPRLSICPKKRHVSLGDQRVSPARSVRAQHEDA